MSKVFDKVLIVMFENQYRSYVMKDPYMKKLAQAGCNMTNYFGAFHPSQTNYIASLAGEVCAVSNDTPPAAPLMQESLTNLMQPKGQKPKVTWKAYMEAYPGQPWNSNWQNPDYPPAQQPITEYPNDGVNLARYFRKHNAFASFHDVQADEDKWNRIVDEFTFWKDLRTHEDKSKNTLPEYAWFTPDIWNDGHYVYNTHTDTNPRTELVGQLSNWLEYVFMADIDTTKVQGGTQFGVPNIGLNLDLDLLLKDPQAAYKNSYIPEGTLVVITWDEADYDANGYDTNYDGQNQVYTVLLGDMITPGTSIDTPYNHYSLIKTIEQNFELGSLNKNDKDSNWFRFLWDEEFNWSSPVQANLSDTKNVTAAYYNEHFYLVYSDSQSHLNWSRFDGQEWSQGESLGITTKNSFTLASTAEEMVLVFADAEDNLQSITYTTNTGWGTSYSLNKNNVGNLSVTTYWDYADESSKLMLAWQDKETYYLYSMIYANGAWQEETIPVGQLTDGNLVISALGGSVYLVYKERNTYNMRMTSFNTAPFNAFDAKNFKGKPDKDNNTSLHQWSPMDFLLGHFSKKLNQHQDDYLANGKLAMAAIEGEMHLAYRARYEDTKYSYTTIFGLTGIMTASSENTNGFGTLNQAGWTREQKHNNIELDPTSANVMASSGKQLLQVYQKSGTTDLYYRIGEYSKEVVPALVSREEESAVLS